MLSDKFASSLKFQNIIVVKHVTNRQPFKKNVFNLLLQFDYYEEI